MQEFWLAVHFWLLKIPIEIKVGCLIIYGICYQIVCLYHHNIAFTLNGAYSLILNFDFVSPKFDKLYPRFYQSSSIFNFDSWER